MRRRDFIKVVAGSVAARPLAAHAQQSAVPVIGYMDTASAGTTAQLVEAFRRGLRGNRVAQFGALHLVRFWHKADMPITVSDVRFWE